MVLVHYLGDFVLFFSTKPTLFPPPPLCDHPRPVGGGGAVTLTIVFLDELPCSSLACAPC